MFEEQKIRERDLRRTLIRYCYWYYVKAEPLVSDRVFDALFRELRILEQDLYSDVKDIPSDSPTQIVYGDRESQYPEWAKECFGD